MKSLSIVLEWSITKIFHQWGLVWPSCESPFTFLSNHVTQSHHSYAFRCIEIKHTFRDSNLLSNTLFERGKIKLDTGRRNKTSVVTYACHTHTKFSKCIKINVTPIYTLFWKPIWVSKCAEFSCLSFPSFLGHLRNHPPTQNWKNQ